MTAPDVGSSFRGLRQKQMQHGIDAHMTPETIKAITNASIATVLAGLLGLFMWLNHREKIAAMQDRDGIYRQLLERQTASLEKIATTYAGDQ